MGGDFVDQGAKMTRSDELEVSIERKSVKYAREKHGAIGIKFKDPSRRNAPDRLFLFPGGKVCFIEFKRDGEEPREGQIEYQFSLRRLGFRASFCDNLTDAKEFLDHVANL